MKLVDTISDGVSRIEDGFGQNSFTDGLGWGETVRDGGGWETVSQWREDLTLPADGTGSGFGSGELGGEFGFSGSDFRGVLDWSWESDRSCRSNWGWSVFGGSEFSSELLFSGGYFRSVQDLDWDGHWGFRESVG